MYLCICRYISKYQENILFFFLGNSTFSCIKMNRRKTTKISHIQFSSNITVLFFFVYRGMYIAYKFLCVYFVFTVVIYHVENLSYFYFSFLYKRLHITSKFEKRRIIFVCKKRKKEEVSFFLFDLQGNVCNMMINKIITKFFCAHLCLCKESK